MSDTKAKSVQQHPHKRPGLLILGILLVGFHGVLWTGLTWGIFQNVETIPRPLMLTLLFVASVASIVAAVAMWLWKRWGFQLFLAAGLATAVLVLMASASLLMMLGSFLQTIIAAYLIYPHLKHFT